MEQTIFSVLDVERTYELRSSNWLRRSTSHLKALDGVRGLLASQGYTLPPLAEKQ